MSSTQVEFQFNFKGQTTSHLFNVDSTVGDVFAWVCIRYNLTQASAKLVGLTAGKFPSHETILSSQSKVSKTVERPGRALKITVLGNTEESQQMFEESYHKHQQEQETERLEECARIEAETRRMEELRQLQEARNRELEAQRAAMTEERRRRAEEQEFLRQDQETRQFEESGGLCCVDGSVLQSVRVEVGSSTKMSVSMQDYARHCQLVFPVAFLVTTAQCSFLVDIAEFTAETEQTIVQPEHLQDRFGQQSAVDSEVKVTVQSVCAEIGERYCDHAELGRARFGKEYIPDFVLPIVSGITLSPLTAGEWALLSASAQSQELQIAVSTKRTVSVGEVLVTPRGSVFLVTSTASIQTDGFDACSSRYQGTVWTGGDSNVTFEILEATVDLYEYVFASRGWDIPPFPFHRVSPAARHTYAHLLERDANVSNTTVRSMEDFLTANELYRGAVTYEWTSNALNASIPPSAFANSSQISNVRDLEFLTVQQIQLPKQRDNPWVQIYSKEADLFVYDQQFPVGLPYNTMHLTMTNSQLKQTSICNVDMSISTVFQVVGSDKLPAAPVHVRLVVNEDIDVHTPILLGGSVCTFCHQQVLQNLQMHELRCARLATTCHSCGESVLNTLLDLHNRTFHATYQCVCGEKMSANQVASHALYVCRLRYVDCHYCQDPFVSRGELWEHKNACSKLAARCTQCGVHGSRGSMRHHLTTMHGITDISKSLWM